MMTTQRNPGRMIVTVVTYLLAGALTTVAVAWASALAYGELPTAPADATAGWLQLDDSDAPRFASVSVAQKRAVGAMWITVHTWGWSARTNDLTATQRIERYQPSVAFPFESCRSAVRDALNARFGSMRARSIAEARGWPMLALWCTPIEQRTNAAPTPVPITPTCGIAVSMADPYGSPARLRTLPLRPLWRGFLLNTLFYACIWLALVFNMSRSRRFIRRRRGRCPMCGYRLADADSGCSECGWGRAS